MAAEKLTRSYIHVPRTEPFIGLTLGQQLYEMTEKYPDKEMYVFYVDKERFTFKQMKEKSQQFAASLLAMGIKKGDTIAVLGNNHSEWLVALYATIQLGILLVPMRTQWPNSTVITLTNELKCKAIILTRSPNDMVDRVCDCFPELKINSAEEFISESCPDLQFVIICGKSSQHLLGRKGVYSYEDLLTHGHGKNIDMVFKICSTIDMDDACCLHFTTGSTGMPKPVVHSHHSILNSVSSGVMRTGPKPLGCSWESIRITIGLTFSSVGSYIGIYLPIVRGSTAVVLYPTFNAQIMAEAIQNERVVICWAYIHHVHDLLAVPNIDSYDFSSLKLLCLGGSLIPHELRQKVEKLAQFITTRYGMTETLRVHIGDPTDPPEKLTNAAMYTTEGIETKIVDDDGNIVPVETTGEILVRGYSTFQFYVGADGEKTKEIKDHNGWVHTGDLGVMDPDGYVIIKGRKKDNIIKEGVNLIPAELETVLYKHPKIKAALTVAIPDEREGEEICACVRLVDKMDSPSENEIGEYCKGKVHTLLVPKYVLFVDEFPVTSNGKFSRLELTKIAEEKINVH